MIAGLPDGEIDGLELETPCELRHLVTQLAKGGVYAIPALLWALRWFFG
jgi:hypothetical protein